MANAEYWRRRFENVETAAHKKADRAIRELDELFLDAQRTVQKEIESWYARYANSNGLSLSEARKQLTAGELEEFKWDVKKYIEIGEKENLSKEWRKKLENASARFHVSRLESVQITIQQQLERLYGNETDKIDKHLRDVAGNGYTRTAYEIQKGIGIGWDITAVNETKLDALLAKPWTTDGKTFSDRLWSNQQQLVQSVTKHLTQGLLRGDSHAKITEALKKDLGTTRYQAGRLVRTETTYMNAVAAKECYKDLGVDSVEIIATLDTHTCETCQPMDGKIIPRSQFEPGVTVPPFHPNCRCTTAPAIDEKYATERIARGADGKTYNVPANMTYEEWKQSFINGDKAVEKSNDSDTMKSGAGLLKMNLQLFAEKGIKKQKSKALKRGIKTLRERISKHEGYIKNPKAHCPDWDELDARRREGLIRHWKKEINNFQESITEREAELRERGDYSD